MKILLIAVIVLGVSLLPLTAAAYDYGMGGDLVASTTTAPSLSNSVTQSDSIGGGTSKPDTAEATNGDNATAGTTRAPAPRATHPASGTTHATRGHAAQPAPGNQSSWQSLLPGSIQ